MAKEASLSSLTKMLGTGDEFQVGGHSYRVLPLLIRDVAEFLSDGVPIQMPMLMLMEGNDTKTGRWLERQVRSAGDVPVTLDMVREHDWSLDDLKSCFERMARLSG